MSTFFSSVLQDVRFAARQLRRSPGFATTAVLTIAVGIAANTSIFSLLDQTLYRSLPVVDPSRLMYLEGTSKVWQGSTSNQGGPTEMYFSYPMYRDLRDGATSFSGLAATTPASVGVVFNNQASVVSAELVSGNYFDVLGVTAAAGRVLHPSDDTAPGANPQIVLSDAYWKASFGGDKGVIGKTLAIDGQPFEIVGVAPPQFHSAVWGSLPKVFVPMSMLQQVLPGTHDRLQNRRDRWLNIFGRLKPHETTHSAEVGTAALWHSLRADELKALGRRAPQFVEEYLNKSQLLVRPGAHGLSYSRDNLRTPIVVIMAMALLILLIASVNVASLLMVRSTVRAREFSLRYALGASGRRVVQQMLLEGVMLGVVGGFLALPLTPAAMRFLVNQIVGTGDSVFTTTIDARLVLFNFAAVLMVSVAFSLVPALRLFKPNLEAMLRQQGSTAPRSLLGFRRLIVGLQVGLSVLLLISSGLFIRTLQKLRHVDLGFPTANLVNFTIDPLLAGYTLDRVPALQNRMFETLSAAPGVLAVMGTNDTEMVTMSRSTNVEVAGYVPPSDQTYDVEMSDVSPGYFSGMQIPLLYGRDFSSTDDRDHPNVAIVNETFAKHFFGTPAAALGRKVSGYDGGPKTRNMEIVGVVHDAKHYSVRTDVLPTVFAPLRQTTAPYPISVYVRSAMSADQIASTIRDTMRQIDPGIAVDSIQTMTSQIEDNLSNERTIEVLAVAFGALATLLAGIGLYGVLSFSTTQRTREIGIRMALGSTRRAISKMVLREVMQLAIGGILFALPCAFLLTRYIRDLLFGISAADPITYFAVPLLLLMIAVAAAAIPARRASAVSPTDALRTE